MMCLGAALYSFGCGHQVAGGREANVRGFNHGTSQLQLQQDLQRHAGAIVERTQQGFQPLLDARDPQRVDEALRLFLVYASSAFEAATGPVPEVSVLDLLVFVVLTRESVERHWIPNVFGEAGRPLQVAMQRSEQLLWDWAEEILTDDKRQQLRALIQQWLTRNPDQFRVETVRFTEFSSVAAGVEHAREANGILASVRSATRAADSALLLSERALFLAQRAPFLLRVQTRLGARELLSDALARADSADALLQRSHALMQQADDLRPLTQDLVRLMKSIERALVDAKGLAGEVRPLVQVVEPLLHERTAGGTSARTGVENLVEETRALTDSLRGALEELRGLAEQSDPLRDKGRVWLAQAVRRIALYAVLIGLLWSAFLSGGYYVARRLADDRARALAVRDHPQEDSERD
jgi:hypothetical protein